MLGNHNNNQILSVFVEKHVDRIKKVDIDIFKSGRDKKTVYKYNAVVSQESIGSRIKIQFLGENHLIIRFLMKLKDDEDIVNALLDKGEDYEKNNLDVQVKTEYGEKYALIGATLNEPGQHTIQITLNNSQTYSLVFYILARELERGSDIDIPVVSYQDALLNVTKLWLLSRKYDRVRQPNWGGFFDDRLRRYEMSEAGARKVEEDLIYAAKQKLGSSIISEVHAKPLTVERGWDVSVVATDLSTGISTKSIEDKQESHILVKDDDSITSLKSI